MVLWDFVRVCNEVRHFSEEVLFLDTTSVCWNGLQFFSVIWFYSEPREREIQRSSQDAAIMDRGGNLPLLVGSALEGELSWYFFSRNYRLVNGGTVRHVGCETVGHGVGYAHFVVDCVGLVCWKHC